MADAAGGQQKGAKRKRIFDDHRPMSAITAGIKQGALHQVPANAERFKTLLSEVPTRWWRVRQMRRTPLLAQALRSYNVLRSWLHWRGLTYHFCSMFRTMLTESCLPACA